MKDFVLVIPARLSSRRLDRKPLAHIGDKPMILHTYERALEATASENIFIATDSLEIMNVCQQARANVVLTSPTCETGTDRIAEFSRHIKAKSYVNLQGDEPLMDPDNIRKMIAAAQSNPDEIINGWCYIKSENDYFSNTIPKVVLKNNDELMYMSRSPIPGNKMNAFIGARKQVCLYSFPLSALDFMIEHSAKSEVEKIEDIEILRFVELGWIVKMIELPGRSIAVDTPDDLQRVRMIMSEFGK